MTTPNWQHHSKKQQKRRLKPQALRQAKKRRGQLINRLLTSDKNCRGSYSICIHNRDTCQSKKSKATLQDFSLLRT